MSSRTYDHLPEWKECLKKYARAQVYFNPPEENGIGVYRVLNLTEGSGFRGGLQFISVPKFKKLIQLFRNEWKELMRKKTNGENVPEDEEYEYGKSRKRHSKAKHNPGRTGFNNVGVSSKTANNDQKDTGQSRQDDQSTKTDYKNEESESRLF